MSETVTHNRRRDCTRYNEPVHTDDAEKRDGETFHRCPSCGSALSDMPAARHN